MQGWMDEKIETKTLTRYDFQTYIAHNDTSTPQLIAFHLVFFPLFGYECASTKMASI